MSKRSSGNDTSTSSKSSSKTVAVAISDKMCVDVPAEKLALAKSRGLSDVDVAKAYASLQSSKAGMVVQLADAGFWKIQTEMLVKRAQVQRAARAADRSERIRAELDERLARASVLLGLSEAEKIKLQNASKALQPVKVPSPKAENAPTAALPATSNGGNGKSKALADQDNPALQ